MSYFENYILLLLVLSQCILKSVSIDYFPPNGKIYCKYSPKNNGTTFMPRNCVDSSINVYANKLFSFKSVFSHDYNSLMCEDQDAETDSPSMNLAQLISGERWTDTSYNLTFANNASCVPLCTKTYSSEKLELLKKAIEEDYQRTFLVDHVPALQCIYGVKFCATAIPIGCYSAKDGRRTDSCSITPRYVELDSYFIFNHLDIEVHYEVMSDPPAGRILGVTVIPGSYRSCDENAPLVSMKGSAVNLTVDYTYSVKYLLKHPTEAENDVFQYELYKSMNTNSSQNVVKFGILNSVILIVALGLSLVGILSNAFCKDTCLDRFCSSFSSKNCWKKAPPSEESMFNGWRVIHGDVFRPPTCSLLLCAVLGSGVQLFCAATITIVCGSAGLLNPYDGVKGQLVTIMFYSWICFGVIAGFVATRLYKLFGGKLWKDTLNLSLVTGLMCPGIVFIMYVILNVVHAVYGSSSAQPVTAFVTILALWLGISLPLTFVGAAIASKIKTIQNPLPTNPVIREIPRRSCLTKPVGSFIVGGFLPFGAIMLQLFFILAGIWWSSVYNIYGFLLIVFAIFVVTICETTVLLCFHHLRNEDYRWWWRSFFNSASSGVYIYIYSIYYYFKTTEITGAINFMMYLGYISTAVFMIMLLTGAVGFFACFFFVRKLYSTVNIEDL